MRSKYLAHRDADDVKIAIAKSSGANATILVQKSPQNATVSIVH